MLVGVFQAKPNVPWRLDFIKLDEFHGKFVVSVNLFSLGLSPH